MPDTTRQGPERLHGNFPGRDNLGWGRTSGGVKAGSGTGSRALGARLAHQRPPILSGVVPRVVTNPGSYGADPRIKPQGIITAYKPASLASPTC